MGGFIGGLGDLFGGAENNAGTVAQNAPLIQPVDANTLNNGQIRANWGLDSQQNLIGALGAQNGIGNQNSVFNQGQGLVNQYSDLANGVGPNPALAQLAQTTGQNIASQASLAAGQRGAGANSGLLARQIGQQGGNIQQQAVGQGATLQAQQQLAALGAKGQALNSLGGLATNQVGQQIGALNNYNNSAQQNQNTLFGANQGYNTANVQNLASQNSANSGIAQTNANNTARVDSGLINSAGKGLLTAFSYDGGEIPSSKELLAKVLSKKQLPDHMRAMAKIYHPKVIKMADGGDVAAVQPIANSDSESQEQSPEQSIEQLAPLIKAMGASKGAVVPGEPKVPGKNTLKNDVVPAMLTPKEIVLPLSVTQAKNPGEAAKLFVEHIKGKDQSNDKDADFKQALRKHMANRKSKA